MASTRTPRALTIAGSDSGGGAGIQADLKAFARCGVHGCCAITAITAQNTLGVSAIHPVAPEMVLAQVRAVVSDIGVDAVKVGMLGDVPTIRAVAKALDELEPGTPVVVDPVMVAESGARLLDPDAQGALVAEILARATVLTPNVPEARELLRYAGVDAGGSGGDDVGGSGSRDRDVDDSHGGDDGHDVGGGGRNEQQEAEALARGVLGLGPRAVVLTGGHREQAVDLLVSSWETSRRALAIPGKRHRDGSAHGSGCTHSSVLAAQLALGRELSQAAIAARALAGEAVANGLCDVGKGPGPVDVIGLSSLRAGR
ncbi:MAG TPA: bifunctional hydroxymethylpyrimidine kinase/phosphomethylpyrimidine kinase [Solirubrobacteraceae bacterium]|nr:bifunctional hydroxymethylpyrimidine kinase/phosphomethylpyrimidine kinase [Solirubrobacteraceae bacterium]